MSKMYVKVMNRAMFRDKNEKFLNFMKIYRYFFYLFSISGLFTSSKTYLRSGNRNARFILIKMRNIFFNIISILPLFACLSYILQPSSESKKRIVISTCMGIVYFSFRIYLLYHLSDLKKISKLIYHLSAKLRKKHNTPNMIVIWMSIV